MNATTTRCFLLVLTVGLATGVMGGATLRSGDASSLQSTSDWPMYRHDAQRSAATAEQLALPLKLAWSYTCLQPPAPAWPDTYPMNLLNRMDFDYAPQLAIAEGIVCFGSSADDTVRALDLKTGQEKWHFITGGPVRFAPQIISNRVYFASDDGYVYCLNAQTGRGIWKFRLAPADERFIGNHRMISRWPIRTGVLVDSGVVYAVAGLWSAEGIFVYALAADTGKVLWCNDTLGGTPQGALLLGGDVLLVPGGNWGPMPFDRRTGAPIIQWGDSVQALWRGYGGTWLTIAGETVYTFYARAMVAIQSYSLTNGAPIGRGWGEGLVPQLSIESSWGPNQIHERGKVSAIVDKGKLHVRKAYGMALAGNTLFLGHDGAVTAEPTEKASTNKMQAATAPWQAKVDGEAREIAVAEGRLFVSTSEGVIYCFAPAGEKTEFRSQKSGGKSQEAKSGFADSNQSEIGNRKSEITLLLQQAGMDRGFALVLGDSDGQMSLALAEQTHLQVINALTNASAVAALRERLLATTAWHGSRIHVQQVARLDALPFAQYFANAVIVADALSGLSGAELYRVLRPCGGIMLFPGLTIADARKLIEETGALESEIRATQNPTPNTEHRTLNTVPSVVRGKLAGALDWDQEPGGIHRVRRGADLRVKWPLRLLWFGGPSTRQVQNFVQGAPGPVPANGRYFMRSERALTAVDAYNGAVLWSRPIPKAGNGVDVDGVLYRVSEPTGYGRADVARNLLVDAESVYLALGAAFFQGKGQGTIQLDACTGEQKKVYGPFNPPTPIVSLKTAQTWLLAAASNQSGSVAMETTSRGLVLTLTAQDLSVTPLDVSPVGTGQRPSRDAWELYFDFRPVEARYGLYERGAFHIRVTPAQDDPPSARPRPEAGKTPAIWSLITGPDAPKLNVSGTGSAAGTKTTVTLPWVELEKWVGAKPTSFDFAATLNAHNGSASSPQAGGRDEPIVRRHLFGNWVADGINNGWARIVLNPAMRDAWQAGGGRSPAGGGAGAPAAAGGTNLPAVLSAAGGLQAGLPAIMGSGAPGGSYGPAGYGQNVDPSVLESPGTHPLTGEPVPKIYGIAPVCGAAYASANIISQAGGFYDLADNSGRRTPCYPGVKTGCTTPQMAALGLFLISEEWGHCFCNYPFRGSLALAPAERRLNEDWAQFYDRDVDTRVRQAFVNLGAAGDRRDEKGNLWLGFPRNSDLRRPEDHPSMHHPLPYPLGMRDAQVGLWPRRPIRSVLWLPLDVEVLTNFGPYRFSADRASIKGTDRPWIYASGYRGITKATMKLNFFKPLVSLPASTVDKPDGRDGARPSTATAAAIAVDGKLNDAVWGDELHSTNREPLLPYTLTRVAFRHDSGNLYMGIKRPPMTVVKRTATSGANASFNYEPVPWRTTTNSAPDAISNGDNWWRLIVSDASPAPGGTGARKALYLTVTPNGTRAEALQDLSRSQRDPAMRDAWQAGGGAGVTTNGLDWTWNPAWQSAVQTNEQGWTLEMAIPFSTLEQAGLKKDQLAVNFMMNDPGLGSEALTYLGMEGFDNCSNFTPLGFGAPVPPAPRSFTIRLHFAEPDNIVAGQRVFDVKLQGQTVLKDFDILKEAKAPLTALVKEFKGVRAAEALTLEFVPAAQVVRPENAPILCGLELAESDVSLSNR